MLAKAEGAGDWSRTAREVVAHVLGMDPWPGAFALRGAERIKIFGAEAAAGEGGGAPGTVLGVERDRLVVACGAGSVLLREVQPPGKKRMAAAAYVSGKPFAPSERLG
jgi:methionyl-tRNA formyltransferase